MTTVSTKRRRLDRSHYLYIAVIVAVVLGTTVGLLAPDLGVALKPLGTGFVSLVSMMVAPVIFCTIVLGVGSVAKAATVGKVGGLALGYFVVMSTFALAIGLVVGNILQPGEGLQITGEYTADPADSKTTADFVLGIIPTSLLSSLTSGEILQALFVALLVGFALQKMGKRGEPVLGAIKAFQTVIFRVLAMLMWLAPIGAFGAIAAVVGSAGGKALFGLLTMMIGFYITCAIFIVVVLGLVLRLITGLSIFSLMKYLGREYLLIVGTSSSETALPRLVAKMEHLGVKNTVVGITVPTGYSFNLDGTAIYLTMSSIFIADALGKPMSIGEQIGLLVFMIIASKGAAGVTGAGLATLAGGLQAYRPDLIGGVGFIVGIDRFMSEARAVTNFTGNAVATVVVGVWTKQFDREQARRVLSGEDRFDESTMDADDHGTGSKPELAESRTPAGV